MRLRAAPLGLCKYLSRPIERFWYSVRSLRERLILDFHQAFREQPTVRGHTEQCAPLDHDASRLRHWGDAELHAMRQRLSVPGRICAAMVLFPNTRPRKVGALPNVADRKASPPAKKPSSRLVSMRCMVNALETGAPFIVRRSTTPLLGEVANGQRNSAPAFR